MTWTDALPNAGHERDTAILSLLLSGNHDPIVWCPVTNAAKGHAIKLWVAEDALKIEGVRVTVSHRLAQEIADLFDARLPTTLISDLAFEQCAVRLNALPQPWFSDGSMGTTARLVEYSGIVDRAIAGRRGLVSCVGKDWVLTRMLHDCVGANYGFHYRKLGRTYLWQSLGTAHNLDHVDYSQNLRLVCRVCEVDGRRAPIDDVLRSADLARLVSTEGAMPFTRHPTIAAMPPDCPLGDP